MTTRAISLAAAAAAAVIGGGTAAQIPHHGAQAEPRHVPIVDRQGNRAGMAVFRSMPNGVLISVEARGLPPGEHGFHIHETGRCDASEGFSTAGGHFAPRGHDHGFEVANGPHAGDMPNQFVAADGTLRAHVFNDRVSLAGGESALEDADGSALMIHAGADDYSSQPSGDAGDRIACAVIAPPR